MELKENEVRLYFFSFLRSDCVILENKLIRRECGKLMGKEYI